MPTKAPIRCIACAKFTFKNVGQDLIELAYGNCLHDAKYIMYHGKKDRQCDKHEALPEDEIEKREKWLDEKIGAGFTG